MRRLYRKFAQNGVILDPNSRFCKFSFPLYFLCIQTNVNYQIVAAFITECESREGVVEALKVVTHWNPSVVPRFALADNDIDEIRALETVFSDIRVLIPSFYCEASWRQRLHMRDMALLDRTQALTRLRAVANADTEEGTQKAINVLKAWHHGCLREMFEKRWQKEVRRWAASYRPLDCILEANLAVERLDEQFRYIEMTKAKDFTISQMVHFLCKEFLPETLLQYKTLNQNIFQREMTKEPYISSYLSDAPQWFCDFLMERIILADKALCRSYVEYVSDSQYSVLSKESNNKRYVSFDIQQKQVTCTCLTYIKRGVICKHAIVVGRFYPMWNLDKIRFWLFDNPVFKADNFCCDIDVWSNDKVTAECEIQLDGEVIYIERNDSIVVSESPIEEATWENKNADHDTSLRLRGQCKQRLKGLEHALDVMSAEDLERFNDEFREFCADWLSNKNFNYGRQTQEQEDIPLPYLKKLSNSSADLERISDVRKAPRERRRSCFSQRASSLRNRALMSKKEIEKTESELKTFNIKTFCEVEEEFPLYTVKLEGKEVPDSNSSKELEEEEAVISEYFDGKANVVIHINSNGEQKEEN